jgi:hypothetical protein
MISSSSKKFPRMRGKHFEGLKDVEAKKKERVLRA